MREWVEIVGGRHDGRRLLIEGEPPLVLVVPETPAIAHAFAVDAPGDLAWAPKGTSYTRRDGPGAMRRYDRVRS